MSFQQDRESNPANQARKIRFITNQGAPHPKRRRVTAACLTCRRRKIACSGEQPACATCRNNKVDCAGYGKPGGDDARRSSAAESSLKAGTPQTSSDYLSSTGRINDAQSNPNSQHGDSTGSNTESPDKPGPTLFSATRNRMPYFRWLGPTAIMPGFKQMVVKVNRHGTGAPSSTDENTMSPNMGNFMLGTSQKSGSFSTAPMPVESDMRTALSLPFYDSSTMPPSELITHLCETFFTHLGCNFPFLQKVRFLKDLESKQVDAILVDAVCAMAARFSTHQLLVRQGDEQGKTAPSEYGKAFAERAKNALVDTYAVPSVAAVQAALLLAYNEFGESRDSGLWMYLGVSIRMAQDLGLQKLQGLRYEGRDGPTPRMVKQGLDKVTIPTKSANPVQMDGSDEAELRAVERERVDTFWAVFFLDRVVSSGVGRRSTLRDNDIEISFPGLQHNGEDDEYPSPFPALIRIVHLYGRVADLLNSIKEPGDITPDTGKRLADMEARVTDFYQSLAERLHFEAMNFHHYVKAGEGTNFVLLHFWFHTLVILLHNPTLLKTFEGKMLQLFPNSQQLSMSSAKTIADILSYSQLIDAKASLGNPFTTQPIYIAACAFLKETAERTASSSEQSRAPSREGSKSQTPIKPSASNSDYLEPGHAEGVTEAKSLSVKNTTATNLEVPSAAALEKSLAKHALLVKRANQDYQLCYQALESLETYWAGTKYILTVLDQKYKGVGDPLLYTAEEGECSLEQPAPEPAFTSPGWRRKISWAPSALYRQDNMKAPLLGQDVTDPSQAIGWTLTGNLNSTNTNLAWHYPTHHSPRKMSASDLAPTSNVESKKPGSQHVFSATSATNHHRSVSSGSLPQPALTNAQPFQSAFGISPKVEAPLSMASPFSISGASPMSFHGGQPMQYTSNPAYNMAVGTGQGHGYPTTNTAQFGDIMIESQDVDMSMLGMDMLSWLDPSPSDLTNMYDPTDMGLGTMQPPPTTQPPR
ncbi:Fungal specific transcription factor domain-containing protein 53 [Elsinoe fawcettii]|nr:Fungal specific transcription factor domain-containing protein 53 [Elsinoe fawcettii]